MNPPLIDRPLLKQPSAWFPLTLSLAALTLVLGYAVLYSVYGVTRPTDEGAAAHIWQILMVIQLPLDAYFAFKWLPRRTTEALWVLALLGGIWFANLVALFLLEANL